MMYTPWFAIAIVVVPLQLVYFAGRYLEGRQLRGIRRRETQTVAILATEADTPITGLPVGPAVAVHGEAVMSIDWFGWMVASARALWR